MIPTLKLDHITKVYKNKKVVDDLSLSLYKGQVFGFIGPKNSGKTTILKMICGLDRISSGHIFIDGYNIDKNFKKAISNVGAVIQPQQFYEHLSGRRNLKILAKLYNKTAIKRIPNIIKLLQMEEYINDKVKNYSLSKIQRLGLAQALLNKPKLLVLDHPTLNLNIEEAKQFISIIKTLVEKEQMTVVISSDNLQTLEHLYHQVAIIRSGKVLTFTDMKKIRADLKSKRYIGFYVNYPNYAGKLIQEKYDIEVKVAGNSILVPISEKHIPQITTYLTYKHIKIFKTKKINKSLQELYLELINDDSGNSTLF